MAEVLLFHHSLGRTAGLTAFAEALRSAGHVVHDPDLYAGRTFTDIEAGVAHAQALGAEALRDHAARIADELDGPLVHAGFSLGVELAQMLVQTRPGAAGALFFDGCIAPAEFGSPWPSGVPVQVHGMDEDPWFAGYELGAARELAATVPEAELFLYPGDRHLFADASLPGYDPDATALLLRRTLDFLAARG